MLSWSVSKYARANDTIEAVLPLLSRDHDRFALLRLSLDRFWNGGIIHVLIRPEDAECTARILGQDRRFRLVVQDSLLGGARYPALLGWWAQQILKLAAAGIVGTDFYLTLDADCLLVRNVGREMLVRKEHGLVEYGCPNHRVSWYAESSRMLGFANTAPAQNVSVTPFLLHTHTAAALIQHIADVARKREMACWQQMLLNHRGWTEYTLYHVFATAAGLWAAHHELESSQLIGPSVWFKQDAETWDAGKAFEGERKFFFVVIQSNTGIDAEWTRARVMRYLR
jgi:hypothetical protein